MNLHLPNNQSLPLTSPIIMGILNVTPDSFSDGGEYFAHDSAVGHGLSMFDQGAVIIDVGGESTRPGSETVTPDEQIARTIPVIQRLNKNLARRTTPHAISIDTTHAEVARAALHAGATIINDVSAGRDDPAIFALAAESGAPLILMHMQGTPKTMQSNPTYSNVVENVKTFLLDRCAAAIAAGVSREQLIIDPGIGFGKTLEHNLALLANLSRFVDTGYPVLLGASRKRFLGAICESPDGSQPLPEHRIAATCATTALAVAAGVHILRVHDVEPNHHALQTALAIKQATTMDKSANNG